MYILSLERIKHEAEIIKNTVPGNIGKVHGVDNLRVVDASIMPECVRANINVTVMAIAERISDFIKTNK